LILFVIESKVIILELTLFVTYIATGSIVPVTIKSPKIPTFPVYPIPENPVSPVGFTIVYEFRLHCAGPVGPVNPVPAIP
jgi:hypothetical protein